MCGDVDQTWRLACIKHLEQISSQCVVTAIVWQMFVCWWQPLHDDTSLLWAAAAAGAVLALCFAGLLSHLCLLLLLLLVHTTATATWLNCCLDLLLPFCLAHLHTQVVLLLAPCFVLLLVAQVQLLNRCLDVSLPSCLAHLHMHMHAGDSPAGPAHHFHAAFNELPLEWIATLLLPGTLAHLRMQVVLLLDQREQLGRTISGKHMGRMEANAEHAKHLRQRGCIVDERTLSIGDVVWVAR
jgi:hypothetical protein